MTTTTVTSRSTSGTERAIAIATSAAPLATGIAAPFLDGGAAFTATLTYGAGAGFILANYMNRLPPGVLDNLPAGDIVRAHSTPMLISTIASGMSLGVGTLLGPAGTDALMAGILAMPSIPGIVSLGWWAAVALVPFKLRNVLRRRPHNALRTAAHTAPHAHLDIPATDTHRIAQLWAQHISDPHNGTHKGQELTLRTFGPARWTGTITAATGNSVTVTPATVSSVFQVPTAWIHFTPGAHEGERHITVNLRAPAELDITTLAGAWKKYVAPSVMKGSHLEDVQQDPATGGEVAVVVADEDTARLTTPNQDDLAGALRTTTLLCSYSPVPGNPRRGSIRLMKHNPLEEGTPFPGPHVLKTSEGGYVQIGRHVSGWPARIQFTDPVLGARHLFIAGVTGSGKGGLVQIVALADHVNGHAIIYADPKGSSNPDIETMAAYSGLGELGSIGAMRVIYALMQWRIEESARLKMKNFVPTPDRPWVSFILDEAHVPLSELEEHKKEAGIILDALAAKARSLGIIIRIVNQAVNADKLGGSTALRTNVIQGGSLVMLRTDSGQKHLASTGFEGIDPGSIPASWDVDRPLVYDEKVQLQDPRSTFGLGYTLGPGGAAEMMRTFILESAAPYIDESAIAYPADWPDWDKRHEIAATSILADGNDLDDFSSTPGTALPIPAAPKKPASADDKIVQALEDIADPLGLEPLYLHKDQIAKLTGLEGSTLNNALSALVKAGRIHRQTNEAGKDVRGMYGPGPAPASAPVEETASDTELEQQINELLPAAIELVVSTQFGSASMLQRKLRIGWDITTALMASLELLGVVGPEDGSEAREVLVTDNQLEDLIRQVRPAGPGE